MAFINQPTDQTKNYLLEVQNVLDTGELSALGIDEFINKN
jgi:hypothetical protein